MASLKASNEFTLTPFDNRRLADLCGQFDDNLHQIEKHLGVQIYYRGNKFRIVGEQPTRDIAEHVVYQLFEETKKKNALTPANIHLILINETNISHDNHLQLNENTMETPISGSIIPEQQKTEDVIIHTHKIMVKPRSENQRNYVKNILKHDLNFAIGPAGTGKTYLAVACAVAALEQERVQRIILVRPAVEAGERLGFLPGDLVEKVAPYLRPLYDALFEMFGIEKTGELLEKDIIEVAPLAYMRGRTLNDAFIILDESQNTTKEQMKMFLTRIGFGSKAVVTGDITQIDLPSHIPSGLRHAIQVFKDTNDIYFNFFAANDVVRHPLVQRIVEAYDKFEGSLD